MVAKQNTLHGFIYRIRKYSVRKVKTQLVEHFIFIFYLTFWTHYEIKFN